MQGQHVHLGRPLCYGGYVTLVGPISKIVSSTAGEGESSFVPRRTSLAFDQ